VEQLHAVRHHDLLIAMAVRRSESVLHQPFAVIAIAAAVAVAVAIGLRAPSSRAAHEPVVDSQAVAPAVAATAGPGPRVEVKPAGAEVAHELAAEDRDVLAWVEWKYRYLLDDVQLDPSSRRQLMQLLLDRERLVRDPDMPGVRGRLDDIERQLRMLLTTADRAQYQALRDSDAEQSHLGDYGDGMENLAPLEDNQRKRLLIAKLRHKADYERDLAEARLDQPVLSAEERTRAYAIVNRALDRYHAGFLRDAREILDEQQFVLLASYEATELERERQRLQIAINAR
jgi:hypothetical protein